MRAATVFNFLIEATLMGSVMILLLLLVRRFLRPKVGSQLICVAWLLVAVRLILPLSLPNPMMNELRPTYSDNVDVRPIADQVRVRAIDAVSDVSEAMYTSSWAAGADNPVADTLHKFAAETSYGHTAKWVLLAYAAAALMALGFMVWRNVRFMRRLKKARVGQLEGDDLTRYRLLCTQRKVKPLPVYWVDPLPSACLVGVFHPYIALPLSLNRKELAQVLAHELCHQGAGDQWWGLVRNACCVLHWFNPLVWLGAHLSRTDQELACDERVTAPMNDEERIDYANTLALAAARRNAPEMAVLATGMTMKGRHIKQRIRAIVDNRAVVGWLCIAALCVAGLGTLFSFATAEYVQPLTMPNVSPMTGEPVAVRAVTSQQEAEAYAAEVLRKALHVDISGFQTEITLTEGEEWRFKARTQEEGGEGYFLCFDGEGRLWQLIDSSVDQYDGGVVDIANPTYRTNAQYSAPYDAYMRSFINMIMPNEDVENWYTDGLYIDSDYWVEDVRFLTFRYARNYTESYLSVCLMIEPEVRVISFIRSDRALEAARIELEETAEQRRYDRFAQIAQAHDAEFMPRGSFVAGTIARNAVEYAYSSLTEIYSYSGDDAERFVYAIVERDGVSYCVFHDVNLPVWNYIIQINDGDYSNMQSPFRQLYTYASESGLRYFLSKAAQEEWLTGWADNEENRKALVDEARNSPYDLSLDPALQRLMMEGELNAAQAVEVLFEDNYGSPDQWNEALTGWRDTTLLRFGLSTMSHEIE